MRPPVRLSRHAIIPYIRSGAIQIGLLSLATASRPQTPGNPIQGGTTTDGGVTWKWIIIAVGTILIIVLVICTFIIDNALRKKSARKKS